MVCINGCYEEQQTIRMERQAQIKAAREARGGRLNENIGDEFQPVLTGSAAPEGGDGANMNAQFDDVESNTGPTPEEINAAAVTGALTPDPEPNESDQENADEIKEFEDALKDEEPVKAEVAKDSDEPSPDSAPAPAPVPAKKPAVKKAAAKKATAKAKDAAEASTV